MNRRGQAIIFTLLFLIPMIVALGLLMRVDSTINLKIRLQDATDAAAQEGGAQVARVMNQIAVHNMAILKYHALQAATKTAQQAANATKMFATQELMEAQQELACWTAAVSQHTSACNPFNTKECDRIAPSQSCEQCLQQQVQMWQKIVNFWTKEEQFFQQQSQQFQSELGTLCTKLGQKSDAMVTKLDDRLKELYDRVGKEHRLHINTTETRRWLNNSKDGKPLDDGQLDDGKALKKGQLRDYAEIAMTGKEQGRQKTDRGLFNFEGPPVQDFQGQKAKEKKGGENVDPPWGPTRYYMEYIYSVHIGLPGYFRFNQMHGPLGNPDSKNSTCGGGQHDGCEGKPVSEAQARDAQIGCNQGKKPCHRDQKDYTATFFHRQAEAQLKSQNDQEFGGNDIVYELPQNPKLEFLVQGRVEADQGFWNRLFKARTVDMPDEGPRDPNNNYLRALSKFELYNLSETDGTILSRGQYDQYAKALLTQDWNAIMTPIVKDEIPNERTIIKDNMVH